MGHRMFGRAHAALHGARLRLRDAVGQGTVEYVALMLLVAGLMAGVIAAADGMKGGGLAETIVKKVKATIESLGGK